MTKRTTPSTGSGSERLGRMTMSARMMNDDVGEVFIYGLICSYAWDDYDTDSKMVREALNAVKDASKLVVHISSPGGYLSDGLYMMDMIAQHNAAVKQAIIEGECCSAATLPTLACDTVSMYEGSWFMIHEPMGFALGTPGEISLYADRLKRQGESVAALYSKKTGKPETEMQQMMSDETWLTAEEAVEAGFASEVLEAITGPSSMNPFMTRGDMQMVAKRLGYKHVPDTLMQRLPEGMAGDQRHRQNGSDAGGAAMNDRQRQDGEAKKMTIEELQKDHPELMTQILNEGRTEGATAERQRMQSLDEIALPGFEQMIADAKYGDKPLTAGEVSMQIVRQQKQTDQQRQGAGASFLAQRKEETEPLNKVPGQSAHDNDKSEEAEMNAQIANFAKHANSAMRG